MSIEREKKYFTGLVYIGYGTNWILTQKYFSLWLAEFLNKKKVKISNSDGVVFLEEGSKVLKKINYEQHKSYSAIKMRKTLFFFQINNAASRKKKFAPNDAIIFSCEIIRW